MEFEQLSKTFLPDMTTGVLPPGEYFVGDPCYTLGKIDKGIWKKFADLAFVNTKDGYALPVFGALLDREYPVIAISTAFGDGVYYDQRGNAFSVDSGCIGVVPRKLLAENFDESKLRTLGIFRTFSDYFRLSVDGDGVIGIGDLRIPTGS